MVCLNYIRGATIQYRNIMEELPSRMPASHKTKITSVKSTNPSTVETVKNVYLKWLSNPILKWSKFELEQYNFILGQ